MTEQRKNTGGERPTLPTARAILDAFDAQMLPTLFEQGTPRLSEPRLTGSALHEKYAPLSREKVSELVAIDIFRAEAADGSKGNISNNEVLVRSTPEGVSVTGTYLHTTEDETHILVYKISGNTEEVSVQHRDNGERGRNLGIKLGSGDYSIDSEHWGEVPVIVHGSFSDSEDGRITRASIQTNIFRK